MGPDRLRFDVKAGGGGRGRNEAVYLNWIERSLSALSNRLRPSLSVAFINPAPACICPCRLEPT